MCKKLFRIKRLRRFGLLVRVRTFWFDHFILTVSTMVITMKNIR